MLRSSLDQEATFAGSRKLASEIVMPMTRIRRVWREGVRSTLEWASRRPGPISKIVRKYLGPCVAAEERGPSYQVEVSLAPGKQSREWTPGRRLDAWQSSK